MKYEIEPKRKYKKCTICSQEFEKKQNVSEKSWMETKYCSRSCYWKSLKGKSPANKTHGMKKTRFYEIWSGMKKRCQNKNFKYYHHYGGRGIKVCDRWQDFMNFKEDMHESYLESEKSFVPSIERVDVNDDYSPENCKWIPINQQSVNRRNVRQIEFNGEIHTLREWSEILEIPLKNLISRLCKKWSIERAFTQKLGTRKDS